jgi:hypothetical protein
MRVISRRFPENREHRALAGGGGGIRTHERLAPLPIFKTGAFNRSATPPSSIFRALIEFMLATLRCECHFLRIFIRFRCKRGFRYTRKRHRWR